MKVKLKKDCKIKAIVWDNKSVLTVPDWNLCYDLAYDKLGIDPPLAEDFLRGKRYKEMLSVPIVPGISSSLRTFVAGFEEANYLQSYTSNHISTEEFWPIACKYGFKLDVTDENVTAIRTAQTHLVRSRNGEIRVIPEVIEILLSMSSILPQFMLSNTKDQFEPGDAIILEPQDIHGAQNLRKHNCICILLGKGKPQKKTFKMESCSNMKT